MKRKVYGLLFLPQVKSQAEAKANQTFDQFQAISYRQQVIAGMNYLIEVSSIMFQKMSVVSRTSRFAYKTIIVSHTRPKSFRLHDQSRFAYTIEV